MLYLRLAAAASCDIVAARSWLLPSVATLIGRLRGISEACRLSRSMPVASDTATILVDKLVRRSCWAEGDAVGSPIRQRQKWLTAQQRRPQWRERSRLSCRPPSSSPRAPSSRRRVGVTSIELVISFAYFAAHARDRVPPANLCKPSRLMLLVTITVNQSACNAQQLINRHRHQCQHHGIARPCDRPCVIATRRNQSDAYRVRVNMSASTPTSISNACV